MTIEIKKPILVAGVSISFLILLWQNLQSYLSSIGEYSLWGLVLISSLLWLWQSKNKDNQLDNIFPTDITEAKFQTITNKIEQLINAWEEENQTLKVNLSSPNSIVSIEEQKQKLLTQLNSIKNYYYQSQSINIAIIGVNQFSLDDLYSYLQHCEQLKGFNYQVNHNLLKETEENNFHKNILLNHDLVLFIIQGDLTDSEKQILVNSIQQQQKTLLLFNEIDYSSPEEQNIIFNQLKLRVKGILPNDDLLSICTNKQVIKVKKYQDGENYQEWEETIQPKYEQLANKLQLIYENSYQNLVLNTAYRQAIEYEKEIKNKVNEILRQKAIPLIEKYQIISASATFANPVSSLDLLATAAINTQMIIDLGNIYHQKFSLNQAQNIAVALAKLMVKLGFVEISTQGITAILKSNAITFLAGGIIQGVSTAYLTRICGLSLIDYFATVENNGTGEININMDIIKAKLQKVFEQYQQANIFSTFVRQTTAKLAKQS